MDWESLQMALASFMGLQSTCCFAFVVTLGAAEWFITSVSSFMSLQIAFLVKRFFTHGAAVCLFFGMNIVMSFQSTQ